MLGYLAGREIFTMNEHSLERFIEAQNDKTYGSYESALNEIKNGKKRTHWIWYIFPQLKGLGRSYNAHFYGIDDVDEAKRYLAHPVLGARLNEITHALLNLKENNPFKVMGSPDDMKLKSCMTLFAYISESDSVFQKVLDKFFFGETDDTTIHILKGQAPIMNS